jgi:hypothetical protein
MMETTMHSMNRLLCAAALTLAQALAISGAGAAVLQSLGAGTAVGAATNVAHFDLNTTLANDWVEDGLLFHFSGYGANNGCGYAGVDCYDAVSDLSPAFAGNYMATSGTNAYVSVRKADGGDIYRIEFAAGSGYLALNGYWATYDDGLKTGSGNFSAPRGAVLGLAAADGFDEVRYFAFSTANRQAGYSAPALDEVRVGLPEPASPALCAVALLGMAAVRRRKRKYA